jgi:hypothetical protein
MYRSQLRFARLVSVALTLTLLFGALPSFAPSSAYADSREDTLFRAEFESAPVGPLAGPLTVETGSIVPQGGSVAVATTSFGRALVLDGAGGQATALLQWNNYPGGLPIGGTVPISGTTPVTLTEEVNVRISGDFTTAISGTAGGSFGLLNGANFFELFSFGANNTLTRGGSAIGRYTPGLPVRLDARIKLKGTTGQVRITVIAAGSATITVPLGSSFNAENLNQLRFQVPAGGALTAADHVRVQLEGKEDDDDPPAVIIIRDDDIEQEFEDIGGVIFVSIKIKIANTGGKAKGCFLVLDLDDLDDLFDLADVSFLEGIGFVSQINASQVIIGLGPNNIVHSNSKLQVKIKFKVKRSGVDIKVNARFKLRFNDTSGERELPFPLVVIVVPVIVVPGLPPTTPISPTVPLTPTVPTTPTGTILRLPVSAVDVRFRAMWDDRGGLDIFGLPLTGPITLDNGLVVQYFERARFEFHPENRGTQYAILLGLLSVELGYATPPVGPPATDDDAQWYFAETGHTIARPFRNFWRTRGGLALFGLPIGEPVQENGLLVQYFERERMELHPDLVGTRYEVQLGHLGVAALEAAARKQPIDD